MQFHVKECLLSLQVRRIVLNLAENADLFGGLVPAKLREDWYLTTPDIAQMDEDESLSLSKIGEIMEKKFGLTSTQCNFVARRQVSFQDVYQGL